MRERSIVLCLVFTILTLGIYGIYWMIVLNNDLLDALDEDGTTGGLVFLFNLLTLGIYGLYWLYQMGRRVDRLNERWGRYTDHSGPLYLVIGILGFSLVAYAVIQNELNNYYRNSMTRYEQ